VLFSTREPAGHDLRSGIVNRTADQMVATILQRNHIAISRFAENLQHFATEHPIVTMQDSGAWFNDDSTHGGGNVERRTPFRNVAPKEYLEQFSSCCIQSYVIPSEVEGPPKCGKRHPSRRDPSTALRMTTLEMLTYSVS